MSGQDDAAAPRSDRDPLLQAARRFGLVQADLLGLADSGGAEDEQPLEADDPLNAEGRRVARIDLEPGFATVYLTFDDRTYLSFAAREDEDGLILLDRFCPPAASYHDYWVFDELEGESGAPPPGAEPEGEGYTSEAWQAALGRTIAAVGWYEEGMQVYLHLEGGGYLTFAARSASGTAYLLGYFSAEEPEDGEYLLFD